jgi:16S rRNA (adenine1518-N6/adenine1519-N6)-dimethyltransferase
VASESSRKDPSPGDLLRAMGIIPSKSLGQHFLHDRKIVHRIVTESGVTSQDVVLEIGPGLGILTHELSSRVRRVVAVERDTRLAEALRDAALENIEVVEADALEVDIPQLMKTDEYHVVANLPYSVGTAIIQKLQESLPPPRTLTLMLQREVAERIVAAPPDMNLLAVAVQFYGVPKLLFRIGAGAFVPPPTVQSAVIRIVAHSSPLIPETDHAIFFRVVRAGFSQPRKQIINNLVHGLGYSRDEIHHVLTLAGIEPTVRPERLTVADWIQVFRAAVAESGR